MRRATPYLLTKNNTFLIGQVAWLLGWLMNGIFFILEKASLDYIGLAIILFTLVIYAALTPIIVQQQKFAKLQTYMQPDLNRIQKKYEGRKDQDSMAKMQDEMNAVYRKYGVRPSGSCWQMVVQMLILFALYQVIYNVPAYVTSVHNAFLPLVNQMMNIDGMSAYLQTFSAANNFSRQFASDAFTSGNVTTITNTYIDVLNRFSTSDWTKLTTDYPALSSVITSTTAQLHHYNYFLGLNIANSPLYSLRNAAGIASVIGAIVVPVLSAVTQLINVALMPQQNANSGNQQQDQMASSMKMMNYMMPIMSAFFCFTLPAGMGIYWIAGSVIRSIQQVVINHHINKMDMDAYVNANMEKAKIQEKKKAVKESGSGQTSDRRMSEISTMSTKHIVSGKASTAKNISEEDEKKFAKAQETYNSGRKYRKDSIAARANLVAEFNDAEKTSTYKTQNQLKKEKAAREKAEAEKKAAEEAAKQKAEETGMGEVKN